MKQILIEATSNTPAVKFDRDTGIVTIEGRSIPENPGEFFGKIIEWTEEYLVAPYPPFTLDIRLDYANSASAKQLLNYLKKVREKFYDGCKCKVNWYFEEDDEAIQELGEHLKSTLGMPFETIIEY
jgi:hypothetical protein